jgi:hypothetical protein
VTANFEVAVTGQSPIVGYAGNTFLLLLSLLSEYTLGLVHHVLHAQMAQLGAPWWEE